MGFISHGAHSCPSFEIWSGGACVQQLRFLDSCNWLLTAMERQQQTMQAAQTAQQNACAAGQNQNCSEATTRFNSEESLYRQFRERYLRCQNNLNAFPWRRSFGPRTGFGLMFDPLAMDWSAMMDAQF